MRTIHLPIQSPCHESWDAMDPEELGRFCKVCDKHVHDISSMTEPEAKQALSDGRQSGARVCVRYRHDNDGKILFRGREAASPLRSIVPRAAVLAVALAACTSHHREEPRDVVGTIAPIEHPVMGEIEALPGDEPCDTPPIDTIPEPTPVMGTAPPPIPEVMGELPMIPEPPPEPEPVIMGKIAAPVKEVKGRIAPPPPEPVEHVLMGDVAEVES